MQLCECTNCTNPVAKKKNGEFGRFCSSICKSRWIAISSIEKRSKTNMARYGVSNPAKTEHVKLKTRQTVNEKYGVDFISQVEDFKQFGDTNCMKNPETRNKIKQTMQTRYGTENALDVPEFKQKYIDTCIERYGVDNPKKNQLVKEKFHNTIRQRYNKQHFNQQHIPDDILTTLSTPYVLKTLNVDKNLTEISNILNVAKSTISSRFKTLGIVPILHGNKSSFQNEVLEFLINECRVPIEFIEINSKTLSKSKEIDIYINKLNLAIECNGTFFHGEKYGNKTKKYHLNKTIMCNDNNIHLLHVFSHDWYTSKHIMKSIILSNINKYENIYYARKTDVRELDAEIEQDFLKRNHIQGSVNSKVCYGLFSDDKLVSLMSFGKPRYIKDTQWELLRYCTELNSTIIGGAEKLFSKFIKDHIPDSVISYSHKHLFKGKMYERIGFKKLKTTEPGFKYTKNYINMFTRQQFQKHKLINKLPSFDPNISEWENMKLAKWDRVWDCGNDVWIYYK